MNNSNGKTNPLGKYCYPNCGGRIRRSERCSWCQRLQQKYDALIQEIELLEETVDLSSQEIKKMMHPKRSSTSCSFCGAPIENGLQKCPYCDTLYEEVASPIDVPVSKAERIKQFDKKIDEAWSIVLQINDIQDAIAGDNRRGASTFARALVALIQINYGTYRPTPSSTTPNIKQSASEIKMAAKYYGIPVSVYLGGFVLGEYRTYKTIHFR